MTGEFFYVRRWTDAGVEVFDVIWSGGGRNAWHFPLHLCTATEKEHAEMVADALAAHLGAEASA